MTAKPAHKAVVFDLDGLMFNTEELYQEVGSEMLRRRGKLFDAALLDAVMGRPAGVALRMMIDYHRLDSTVEELEAETDALFEALLETRLRQMPGLVALLDALERADTRKAIATSSGPDFAQTVLDKFQLTPRFEFVLTSRDIRQGKPHPEIYLLAAERLGLAPGALVVLEDSQNGCKAALEAGAVVVAVPGGHSRRHDFAGVALVAESLSDRRLFELLRLA